jgi:hypothetical protein
MIRIQKASLLAGVVAVAVLALGGFAPARPAGAAVNSISIVPVTQTVPPGAKEITISLELNGTAPGIGGWDIDVAYDDTLLRVTACSPTAGGFCSVLAEPAVNFGGKSAAGLTGSPLQLGTITFQADTTGGTSAIEAEVIQLTDPDGTDIAFAPPAAGAVIVEQPFLKQGDADCSSSVNSVDALLVLRFGAGLGVNQNEPCPDIGAVLTLAGVFGDVDCTGTVNAVDALKILRFGAALSVAQDEPPSCVDLGQLLEIVDAEIVGGVLNAEGTSDDDKLILRLNAGNGDLEIDVADDGIGDFSLTKPRLPGSSVGDVACIASLRDRASFRSDIETSVTRVRMAHSFALL